MTIDDETFFAWLDGELDDERAAEVEAAVAADPARSRQAAQHRAMQASLRGAFAPIMDAPVPDRIAEPPADFAAARARRDQRRPVGGGLPQWAAMAATLVLGLGLGTIVTSRGSADSPVTVEGGQMIAAASLKQALDTQLASAEQPKGAPRIGLTFRSGDGALCRSFAGAAGASGLACRSGDEWRVKGLFGGQGPAGGDYRMAAGEDPQLAALIDTVIAGDPLDAGAEKAARDKGWR